MIRRETDYAIRILIFLARSQTVGKDVDCESTATLAQETGVPYRFLRKIVLKLSGSGLLVSRRGKGGGVMLAREPESVSLLEIMEAMEPESVVFNACFVQSENPCKRQSYCGLHQALSAVQASLHGELHRITIASMASAETCGLS
jgi:Rrf2 family protein